MALLFYFVNLANIRLGPDARRYQAPKLCVISPDFVVAFLASLLVSALGNGVACPGRMCRAATRLQTLGNSILFLLARTFCRCFLTRSTLDTSCDSHKNISTQMPIIAITVIIIIVYFFAIRWWLRRPAKPSSKCTIWSLFGFSLGIRFSNSKPSSDMRCWSDVNLRKYRISYRISLRIYSYARFCVIIIYM